MNMRDLIPWGRQSSTAPVQYQNQDNPIVGFRREVDRLFDDLFRGSLPSLGLGGSLAAWPNVELSETDREIRITAEVPGMSEKDVELLMEDGVLTIRGEKKSETEDKDRGYSERYYGRFERRIALPSNVDEQGANANFKDGVLTVTLPKSAEADGGRRIPINGETTH
ncbi:Hsp20/alpha crystallin family protein [Sphingomonas parva]|uniref:Hsp20/alpha crystallin family protein n=1 Tax=Sphingomonas parva TaxID=2555898 RepID=A0A4Y8ZPU0_9SPHN|nr:Hsp20/alpha crystallin family protein [Sphingomonas parva]TFI57135.1 Hsp20/alpha crystallin family protein [Sphingomonas parva]